MSNKVTVGELVIAFLENLGVEHAFGIVSIHNLPMFDAMARRNKIRFVPVRNEAGAVNMAEAGARLSGGIGVAFTSTGAGVGNAAAAMMEAISAGTPLLHFTGNVESPFIDRFTGYTHETPNQLKVLEGISKAAFRIRTPETALGVLRDAARAASTAPKGPVSVEIPIDLQKELVEMPASLDVSYPAPEMPDPAAIDELAKLLKKAKRPMLWLGGGAVEASDAARKLVDMGMGAASSVQGRGVVPDDHPQNLCSFTSQAPSAEFLKSCDFVLAVGTKFRSAQTRNHKLPLPHPLVNVDSDAQAQNRNFRSDLFIHGDARLVLEALVEKLDGLDIDPDFHADLAKARKGSEGEIRELIGPYERLLNAVANNVPEDFNWVRDITMNNSTWGNRLPPLREPRMGVYAVSGGIGQGLAQAIGAAIVRSDRKTISIIGDGGFVLSMGEIATAVQEKADVTFLLMNDGGYGIMRNLQDSYYEGRRFAADLVMPDFGLLAQSLDIPHRRIESADDFEDGFKQMLAIQGPSILEIDMAAVGPFAKPFGGPPVPYGKQPANA